MLFDLSQPSTFFDLTGKETHDVKYFMNELDTHNRNTKVLKFLIGTNADRVDSNFDTQDAEQYALRNVMQYFEISCMNTE